MLTANYGKSFRSAIYDLKKNSFRNDRVKYTFLSPADVTSPRNSTLFKWLSTDGRQWLWNVIFIHSSYPGRMVGGVE